MSSSVDFILIGNISTEPTTRQVGENTVTNFNVAVNRKQNNKEFVVYYRVAAWNGLSDVVSSYAHKGDPIKVYANWIQPSVYNNEAQLDVTAGNITLLASKRGPVASNGTPAGNSASQTDDIPF